MVCPKCAGVLHPLGKRSVLGFPKLRCRVCSVVELGPLSAGYRRIYWGIGIFFLLGTFVYLAEGRVLLPGLPLIGVAVAIVTDLRIRRRNSSTSGPQRSPGEASGGRAELVDRGPIFRPPGRGRALAIFGAIGLMACAAMAVFPPWRGYGVLVTTRVRQPTYFQILAGIPPDSTTQSQRFDWVIPFAPIFWPPNAQPYQWEGPLKAFEDSLKQASRGAGALFGNLIEEYSRLADAATLRRAEIEHAARIPAPLRQPEWAIDTLGAGGIVHIGRTREIAFAIDWPRLGLQLSAAALVVGATLLGAGVRPARPVGRSRQVTGG